jgi:hypothetical protein
LVWANLAGAVVHARSDEPEPVKCLDCIGGACHAVYGPGFHSCFTTEVGCFCEGDCG